MVVLVLVVLVMFVLPFGAMLDGPRWAHGESEEARRQRAWREYWSRGGR